MKRSKLISLPLILLMTISCLFGITGCTKESLKTPQEIIQDAYGNKEFKISFSSETLDRPLKDITYSANKIPLLPTPQKVGYIFEGWYLDPDFVIPYTDDTLYLRMEDITLYPKWSVERFDHLGTYDIKLEGRILPETLKLGATTEKYGGYRDFTELIDIEATHIEKDSNDLILKLVYDGLVTTPFQAKGRVFSVLPNKDMPSSVRVVKQIDSLSDPVKTLFFNINDWDLSKPLKLDIIWTNFESDKLDENTRYETTTSYTVELRLTEIIGFSQSFVDTSVPLEKGYYLAKSYYRKEDNTESMGSIYNPVYSYLYSDGKENYKLIKQNSPYLGLVAQEHPLYKPIIDNYYERMMAFTGVTTVFDIDKVSGETPIESDYYPETYNGGSYRETAVEFHKDSGKFYNIIDIDKDLSKEYIALTGISGFMEKESGMGYVRQILSIDYENLIKLADCDYKPLEGDAFEYEDKLAFYPGNYDDLDTKDLTEEAILKYGISFDIPNFFYSAKTMNAPYKERTMYSSRVTTTPSGRTKHLKLSESRGVIGEFDINGKIFGYTEKNGENLYMDRMAPQTFEGEGYNNMLRYNRIVKNGKTLNIGDSINLEELFKEKVNKTIDYQIVSYKAYKMEGFDVNFDIPINVEPYFDFKENIAIEYVYKDLLGYEMKTIVELQNKSKPKIKIRDNIKWRDNGNNRYSNNITLKENDRIAYPMLTYDFGSLRDVEMVDNFYMQLDGRSINPAKALIFAEVGYSTKTILPSALTEDFIVPSENMSLMYELNNQYNEREFIYFDYVSTPKKTYKVIDDTNTSLIFADVIYDKDTGIRKSLNNAIAYNPFYDEFKPEMIRSYYHEEAERDGAYTLSYIYVSTNSGYSGTEPYDNKASACQFINNYLKDKKYGIVSLVYIHSGDRLTINYPYNLTFNGIDTFEALGYEAYFTDTVYTFSKTNLIGDRKILDDVSITIDKIINGRPSSNPKTHNDYRLNDDENESQIKLEFLAPGLYRLESSYYIPAGLISTGNGYSQNIRFYQYFEVISRQGDVTVTYVTDELHPFKGGMLEKVVTYNLADGITILDDNPKVFSHNGFAPGRNADILLRWNLARNGMAEKSYYQKGYIAGDDFISDYNTDNLVLYAVWDLKISVEFHINEKIVYKEARLNTDGRYQVESPKPPKPTSNYAPVFIGWSGGFLGSSIFDPENKQTGKYITLPIYKDYSKIPEEDLIIHAVFKERFRVVYDMGGIAEVIRSEAVMEGEIVPALDMKLNPIMKDEYKNYRLSHYTWLNPVTGLDEKINISSFIMGSDKVNGKGPDKVAEIRLKAVFVRK